MVTAYQREKLCKLSTLLTIYEKATLEIFNLFPTKAKVPNMIKRDRSPELPRYLLESLDRLIAQNKNPKMSQTLLKFRSSGTESPFHLNFSGTVLVIM